jgi:copper chaperone NosL
MKSLSKHFWVIIALVCFSGCKTSSIEPVALEREDMCSYCKMAISEKQYAAEFIDNDGKVFKFDDIGCMVNFIQTKKVSNIAAYFVMDLDSKEWLKADNAFFVRAPDFYTPMGGNTAAFKDKARAQKAVEMYRGKLLSFKEVLSQ